MLRTWVARVIGYVTVGRLLPISVWEKREHVKTKKRAGKNYVGSALLCLV